jgi:nitrate reductase (cytochrome), electron transfer subunit
VKKHNNGGPNGSVLLILIFSLIAFSLPTSAADGDKIQSLRGDAPVEETTGGPEIERQKTGQRFARAYRQQPPLIPHKIDKYQINLKVNQCLRCHDWPYNVEEKAPKVSETHYSNRDGIALDKVTRSRWFCTQCHVPQDDAKDLVPNTFRSAFETK